MPTADILIGLPGSGKSTYTRRRMLDGYTVINKDQLIYMCHGGSYDFREDMAILYDKMFLSLIRTACLHGDNIIVDDVNLSMYDRALVLQQIPRYYKVKFTYWKPNFELNVANRSMEPRGYTSEMWRVIIEKMLAKLDDPSDSWTSESCDEFESLKVYPKGTIEHP